MVSYFEFLAFVSASFRYYSQLMFSFELDPNSHIAFDFKTHRQANCRCCALGLLPVIVCYSVRDFGR